MNYRILTGCISLGLLAALAHAEPPKINVPDDRPPAVESTASAAPAAAAEPISTTVSDPSNKDWKEYSNRIVKMQVRVKGSWTLMEIKETQDTGSVSFTLSRSPLTTFSVTRQQMDGPFDAYISSPALTQIFPTGFQTMPTKFAGRKAVMVKGNALDERLDESYFLADGNMLMQVSFTAPKDAWKDAKPSFDNLKKSFRWMPKPDNKEISHGK